MQGFRGKRIRRWLKLPFIVTFATFQAMKVIKKWKPAVILVMGGYISVPVAIAARILGVHLIIHEQNAVIGRANRWLSRIANVMATSFEGTLGAENNDLEIILSIFTSHRRGRNY